MVADSVQAALPGLEDRAPDIVTPDLEVAVRRTIAALAESDALSEASSAQLQLAIDLARIIDAKRRSNRMSTVSNDARLLSEILDKLSGRDVMPGDESGQRLLLEAMRQWGESGHVAAS